jgi:hypothetical protein
MARWQPAFIHVCGSDHRTVKRDRTQNAHIENCMAHMRLLIFRPDYYKNELQIRVLWAVLVATNSTTALEQ